MELEIQLTDYIMCEPFVPFRIRMSNGECFDIREPDVLAIGVSRAFFADWRDERSRRSRGPGVELPLRDIEAIERPVVLNH